MSFIFVLASWDGSASNSRVLKDAISRPNGLKVHTGTLLFFNLTKIPNYLSYGYIIFDFCNYTFRMLLPNTYWLHKL